jgi:GDPmannose 4,6-dehydratase
VATNETHSIREFLDIAFNHVNLDWHDYVEFDARYLRPAEVDLLIGDATKAREALGWQPSVTFEELVHLMVEADLEAIGISDYSKGEHRDMATLRRDLLSLIPQG